MAGAGPSSLPAFEPPGTSERPGWPGSLLEYNLPLRATGGLTQVYAAVNRSRLSEGDATAARGQTTYPDGSLGLAPDMPLLAKRYRFLHALSETSLSQLLCAVDTYSSCAPQPDGRRQPLVAIKVLNAQHWVLGAQEYERMRRLRVAQDQDGVQAALTSVTAFFECGAHFCIVMPLLCKLGRELGRAGAAQLAAQLAEQGLPPTQPAFAPRLSTVKAQFGSAPADAREQAGPPLLDVETIRRVSARLLGALAFLEQHDVIHADVKPENVMSDPVGAQAGCCLEGPGWRARLIDFSNAMTPAEATAYHDTFDVQVLWLYRRLSLLRQLPNSTYAHTKRHRCSGSSGISLSFLN